MNRDLACKHWYVAYTYPKAEKKIKRTLEQLGVDTFLPLYKAKKQWSDRVKTVELPVFPNYIFIHTSLSEMYILPRINGIVRYVKFGGKAATLNSNDMELLRMMLSENATVSSIETGQIGMKLRISYGSLTGMEGTLIGRKGRDKLIVQIEFLNRVVSVEVSSAQVEALGIFAENV
jgi:transcription antitermination factor NusG